MSSEEYSNLSWINYFEDIGEGRRYKGHWIKNKELDRTIVNTNSPRKASSPFKEDASQGAPNSGYGWKGFGTIMFDDGSKYQGQTADGLFNGVGRMEHANGDIY